MSLQSMFDYAQSCDWAREERSECPCRGGWLLSDLDTWHRCPLHADEDPRNPEERGEDFAYLEEKAEEQTAKFAGMGEA